MEAFKHIINNLHYKCSSTYQRMVIAKKKLRIPRAMSMSLSSFSLIFTYTNITWFTKSPWIEEMITRETFFRPIEKNKQSKNINIIMNNVDFHKLMFFLFFKRKSTVFRNRKG